MPWSHVNAEGDVEFKAVLYVPPKSPHDLYESYYYSNKANLKLCVRRVFTSDEFDDLLPKYLSFLKVTLNVSREMLQQHSSLIKKKLIRKALDMIRKLAEEDSDEFQEDDQKVVTSKFGWSANTERIMQSQTLSDANKQAYMRGKQVLQTALIESGFLLNDPKDFAARIYNSVKSGLNISPDAFADEEVEAEETETSEATGTETDYLAGGLNIEAEQVEDKVETTEDEL